MKIAFSGPSGLGKSTLCKFVSEEMDVPWISTSAGHILTDEDKAFFKKSFGYSGEGHKNVINMSSVNPEFGGAFQKTILTRRGKQIVDNPRFVIDRSPIDNVAYFISQNSHNISEGVASAFIEEAQSFYSELDYVIQLRYSNDIPFIEDNGSRVPNKYFQIYSSDVFAGVYARYFANLVGKRPRVMTLDFWDLSSRKAVVKEFINPSQVKLFL